uniref:Alkaline serine protease n=1 Tax=Onygena corvina TaxID=180788 RepID=A0A0B4VLG1_9EURO|nr:alkaline serine protease [Onygena corvina]
MKIAERAFLIAVGLALFGAAWAVDIIPASVGTETITDTYVVVMKDEVLAAQFDSHKKWIGSLMHQRPLNSKDGEKKRGLRNTFNVAGLRGYSGTFDKETIQEIARSPDVKHIEQDAVVNALGLISQPNAGWHLSRISHRVLPTVPEYVYEERAGKDVHVYVLDTGIDGTNMGLRGRVIQGINTSPNGNSDVSGHGTSIAEIIGGTVHGVAKKALMVSVKILGDTGSGSISGIIQGLDWSIKDVEKRNIVGKAVMNMSFGGSFSAALNQATEKAINSGIFVAASVGASNRDASSESPVSASGVCAVAASTMADAPASFGSYGPIGVAAFAIDMGVSSDKVCDTIKRLALPSIQNPRPGTTNLLLYNGSGR